MKTRQESVAHHAYYRFSWLEGECDFGERGVFAMTGLFPLPASSLLVCVPWVTTDFLIFLIPFAIFSIRHFSKIYFSRRRLIWILSI